MHGSNPMVSPVVAVVTFVRLDVGVRARILCSSCCCCWWDVLSSDSECVFWYVWLGKVACIGAILEYFGVYWIQFDVFAFTTFIYNDNFQYYKVVLWHSGNQP